MNYTEEEIKVLTDSLPTLLERGPNGQRVFGEDLDAYLIEHPISRHSFNTCIPIESLIKLLKCQDLEINVRGDEAYAILIKQIWSLLHSTPLEEIPLYLNIFPQIANWRMKIGK